MKALAIEIHDTGLLALDSEGVLSALGPGFALLEKKRPLFGFEAAERARLAPGRIYNRYWEELDTTALGRPFPRGLSRADLANGQLAAVWERLGRAANSVLLAVPGTYSEEQLGLLLGIALANHIPVTALVDAGLAALCHAFHPDGGALPACERVLFLDMHLHRAIATELVLVQESAGQTGYRLERRRLVCENSIGQLALHRLWARYIAQRFIAETRFDPLHAAQTEQVLYLLLPDWLAALGQEPVVEASLSHRGRSYTVLLEREGMNSAAAEIYEGLVLLAGDFSAARPGTKLVLSHRLAELPGLTAYFNEPVHLGEGAVPDGLLRASPPTASTGQTPFLTRLAIQAVPGERREPFVAESNQEAAPAPTHFLQNGLAYPVAGWSAMAGDHCRLVPCDGALLLSGVTNGCLLNGLSISGETVLASGDRLTHGGHEIQLIRVVT